LGAKGVNFDANRTHGRETPSDLARFAHVCAKSAIDGAVWSGVGNHVTPLRHTGPMSNSTPSHHGPEQLVLVGELPTPVQFRLDQRTRERGLAHIAAIKAQLAARAAARQEAPTTATKAA
jgi:hypothetical protein